MFGKICILFLCLGSVFAIELKEVEVGPVAYEFHYSVHDPHTGDIKSQKEVRKDDKVEGIYELIDSDGHRRVVHYKADDHSGFEAIVQREPTDIKIPLPEPKKLIGTKTLLTHAPLVHIAPKPLELEQLQHVGQEAPQYGNYVSVSGPSSHYKY